MNLQQAIAPGDLPWSEGDVAGKTRDAEIAPVPAFFPDNAERRYWNDFLSATIAEAEARVVAGPVTPTLDGSSVREKLASFDFAAPQPLQALLPWVIAQLENGVV